MILQGPGSETDWHMQVSWMSSDRWRSSSIPIRTLVLIDLQLMGQSKDGQSTFNTFAWCSGHLISGCLVHILYYTVRIYHISQYITCSFECKLWGSAKDFVQVTVFKKIMTITRTLNPAPDAGWVLALTHSQVDGGKGAITVGQLWNGDDLNEHKTLARMEPVTTLFYHTSVPQSALLGSHSSHDCLLDVPISLRSTHLMGASESDQFYDFIGIHTVHQQQN